MPVEPPIPQKPETPSPEAPPHPSDPGQPETPQPEFTPPAPDIDFPDTQPSIAPAGTPIQPTA